MTTRIRKAAVIALCVAGTTLGASGIAAAADDPAVDRVCDLNAFDPKAEFACDAVNGIF